MPFSSFSGIPANTGIQDPTPSPSHRAVRDGLGEQDFPALDTLMSNKK